MKYVLIYVRDLSSDEANFYTQKVPSVLPGTMFEVDRYDDLESANKAAKAFNSNGGHLLILPYYKVEI